MLPLVIIINLFFPIISTVFIITALYIDKEKYRIYLFLLVLNIALIGYYFEPYITNDLYRHYEFIDYMKIHNLKTVFSIDALFIKNIWFYLVGVSGLKSLLPFSAILITYYIALTDIFEYSKISNIKHTLTVNFSIFVLIYIQLIWVMSGIRFSIAFVLFLHGLYREFIKKERGITTYLYYLLPCFIHYSIFVLVIIRLFLLFKGVSRYILSFILLIWGFFTEAIAELLNLSGVSYFQGIASKIEFYIGYSDTDNYSIFTNILKLFVSLLLTVTLLWMKKNSKAIFKKYEDIYLFTLYLSLFCLGGYNIFIIPDRFGFVLITLSPIVLMPFYMASKNKIIKYFAVLSFLPIILAGIYLQYIPLKATNYSIGLVEFFLNNIFQLLFRQN